MSNTNEGIEGLAASVQPLQVGTLRGDAIQEITKLARRGSDAQRFYKTSRDDTILIFNDEKGTYDQVTLPEPGRVLNFNNINSLVRALHDVPEEKTGSSNYMPQIFYSRRGISAFYGLDAHHVLKMGFKYHPAFLTLKDWGKKPQRISQPTLITTLRTIFRTCYDAAFLERIRHIAWSNVKEGNSTVSDQGRSMHASVISKVLGDKESSIPDTTQFVFAPIHQFPQFTIKITCYVVVDSNDQTFIVCPYPGEIETAYWNIENELDRLLGIEIGERKTVRYLGSMNETASDE